MTRIVRQAQSRRERHGLVARDLMTSSMLTLSPEMTLRDAIDALVARHVTGAPVVSGERVLGTLSANDVLAFVATIPGVPTERQPDALYDDAGDDERGDAEGPPGAFFTDLWDDAGAEVSERLDAVEGPEWDVLDEHTVAEAMSTAVVLLPPTTSLRGAAVEMLRTGAHRVLVGSHDRLLGILTTMDITRAVAGKTHAPDAGATGAGAD
jgi:CBS domain-containing protein